MKIFESELKEKIKIFENEDILVKFDILLQGKFEFSKTRINYNRKTGFLNIEDTTNDNEIRINLVSAYEFNLECRNLQILLDNDLEIQIMVK